MPQVRGQTLRSLSRSSPYCGWQSNRLLHLMGRGSFQMSGNSDAYLTNLPLSHVSGPLGVLMRASFESGVVPATVTILACILYTRAAWTNGDALFNSSSHSVLIHPWCSGHRTYSHVRSGFHPHPALHALSPRESFSSKPHQHWGRFHHKCWI